MMCPKNQRLRHGIVKAPTSGENFLVCHINSHTKSHLGFSKFQFANGQNGQEGQTASLCQLLPRSKVVFFRFFQNGGRRHLGFLEFLIFNGLDGQEVQSASSCQISAAEIWRFFDFSIWRPPPSWIIEISNF